MAKINRDRRFYCVEKLDAYSNTNSYKFFSLHFGNQSPHLSKHTHYLLLNFVTKKSIIARTLAG